MKICFIGDIHGRVFHALAAIVKWQIANNQKFDMIIQVGDFGAYPKPNDKMLNNKFILEDPTELDFCKYLNADRALQNDLSFVRSHLNCPIHFIRGNHEDFQWLNSISENGTKVKGVDHLDLIRYIPDGSIIDLNNLKFAFLGGIETNEEEARSINQEAYNSLLSIKPEDIDILVTHDSPYGTGVSFTGEVQGSRKITTLLEAMQPKYLIAGHYHHAIDLQNIGSTQYLGLNILIPPMRKDKKGCVQQGSMATFDTDNDVLEFVHNDCFSQIDRGFDFRAFVRELRDL